MNDDSLLNIGKKDRIHKKPKKRDSVVCSITNLHKYKMDGAIMINQYKIIQELGKGAFGKVVLCRDTSVKNTENLFAIKIMNKKELKARKFGKVGENAYDCVLEELKVLSRLEHPNVIWLHEIIDDDKKTYIYLVTEYHAKGSIGDLIEKLNDGTSSNSPNVRKEKEFQILTK